MRKVMVVFLVGWLSCWQMSQGVANLDLELTRGKLGAVPIAVVPFAQATANVPGQTTLSAVIAADLTNSGQFNVKSAGSLSQKPTTLADVNLKYWQAQRMNDLVIGQVKALSGQRFQVSFQLINVFGKPASTPSDGGGAPAPTQANDLNSVVLASESFTTSASGLRVLAHHISDTIYQKLTGIRGIFSTKIAYILVRHALNQPVIYSLEVADQDGFNEQTLLRSYQPIMSPAWSPDGKELAYVSFEKGDAGIYIQDVSTGNRRLISHYPGVNGAPAFSPDGSKLALVLTKTGNPKIFTLDIASGQLTEITHGYAIDTEPSWAPDGQSLLFTSSRGGTPQIYRYYFATQRVQRVTFDGNYNARASFLPNEKGIVMMHRETGLFGIATQDLTSSRVQVLAQSGNDESPSIAPNGRMVLYASRYAGRRVLGVVSIDARVKLRLPAKQGSVQEPAWSPFLS